MPLEPTTAVTAVPAVFSFLVKGFQLGYDINAVPAETTALLQTIAGVKSEIQEGRRLRKEMAKTCEPEELVELDEAIDGVSSALLALERLVEPTRVAMRVNHDQVSAWRRLMWVMKDSNQVLTTSNHLVIAHSRFQTQIVLNRLAPNPSRVASARRDYSPPPPYVPHQDATKLSMHERRQSWRPCGLDRSGSVNRNDGSAGNSTNLGTSMPHDHSGLGSRFNSSSGLSGTMPVLSDRKTVFRNISDPYPGSRRDPSSTAAVNQPRSTSIGSHSPSPAANLLTAIPETTAPLSVQSLGVSELEGVAVQRPAPPLSTRQSLWPSPPSPPQPSRSALPLPPAARASPPPPTRASSPPPPPPSRSAPPPTGQSNDSLSLVHAQAQQSWPLPSSEPAAILVRLKSEERAGRNPYALNGPQIVGSRIGLTESAVSASSIIDTQRSFPGHRGPIKIRWQEDSQSKDFEAPNSSDPVMPLIDLSDESQPFGEASVPIRTKSRRPLRMRNGEDPVQQKLHKPPDDGSRKVRSRHEWQAEQLRLAWERRLRNESGS